MNLALKNLHDFEFILSEIRNIQKDVRSMKESVKTISDLYTINLPSGGFYLTGRDAARRFVEITDRALNANKDLRSRIKPKTLENAIRNLFAKRILDEKIALTQSAADKIVSGAVKEVKNGKVMTKTCFIPVFLPLDKDADELFVGRVRFITTKKFFIEKEQKLTDYQNDVVPLTPQGIAILKQIKPDLDPIYFPKENAEREMEEFRRLWEEFPWIASVLVENYDEKRIDKISLIAVNIALNAIRIMFPIQHAEKIHMSGRPRWQWEGAKFYELPDSKISISRDKRWKHSTQDGWIRLYTSEGTGEYLHLLGELVSPFLSPNPVPELYQRYVNALWWYGEALQLDMLYLRVTALANALEAFLGTSPDKISEQIAARGALFLRIHDATVDWYAKIKKFYDTRSDLVHGRIPAFSDEVHTQIDVGLIMVQRILIEGLSWTHETAHRDFPKDLDQIHNNFEKYLRQYSEGTLPPR